jgi:hypothetical protein
LRNDLQEARVSVACLCGTELVSKYKTAEMS